MSANSNETEVFRLTTEIGETYRYAECTRRISRPTSRYFAPSDKIKMVGVLIEIKEGGFADDRWREDIFSNDGEITRVKYSYGGNTCFIKQ